MKFSSIAFETHEIFQYLRSRFDQFLGKISPLKKKKKKILACKEMHGMDGRVIAVDRVSTGWLRTPPCRSARAPCVRACVRCGGGREGSPSGAGLVPCRILPRQRNHHHRARTHARAMPTSSASLDRLWSKS